MAQIQAQTQLDYEAYVERVMAMRPYSLVSTTGPETLTAENFEDQIAALLKAAQASCPDAKLAIAISRNVWPVFVDSKSCLHLRPAPVESRMRGHVGTIYGFDLVSDVMVPDNSLPRGLSVYSQ